MPSSDDEPKMLSDEDFGCCSPWLPKIPATKSPAKPMEMNEFLFTDSDVEREIEKVIAKTVGASSRIPVMEKAMGTAEPKVVRFSLAGAKTAPKLEALLSEEVGVVQRGESGLGGERPSPTTFGFTPLRFLFCLGAFVLICMLIQQETEPPKPIPKPKPTYFVAPFIIFGVCLVVCLLWLLGILTITWDNPNESQSSLKRETTDSVLPEDFWNGSNPEKNDSLELQQAYETYKNETEVLRRKVGELEWELDLIKTSVKDITERLNGQNAELDVIKGSIKEIAEKPTGQNAEKERVKAVECVRILNAMNLHVKRMEDCLTEMSLKECLHAALLGRDLSSVKVCVAQQVEILKRCIANDSFKSAEPEFEDVLENRLKEMSGNEYLLLVEREMNAIELCIKEMEDCFNLKTGKEILVAEAAMKEHQSCFGNKNQIEKRVNEAWRNKGSLEEKKLGPFDVVDEPRGQEAVDLKKLLQQLEQEMMALESRAKILEAVEEKLKLKIGS